MALTKELAQLLLFGTSNQELLAEAVKSLGDEVTAQYPKIAFPGAWVLAQQRRPVAIAAHAAAFCDSAEVQEQIWRSTRRQAVRMALAGSFFLDEDLRRRLLVELEDEYSELARALGSVHRHQNLPRLLEESLSAPSSFFDVPEYHEYRDFYTDFNAVGLLCHPEMTPEQSTELLSRAPSDFTDWLLEEYLTLRCESHSYFDSPITEELDGKTMISLVAVPRSRAQQVFVDALADIRSFGLEEPFDADEVRCLLALPRPISVSYRSMSRWRLSGKPCVVFTDEAMDLLLDAGWYELASISSMTDAQFERFCSFLPWKSAIGPKKLNARQDLVTMVVPHITTAARLQMVIGTLPDGLVLDADSHSELSADSWFEHVDAIDRTTALKAIYHLALAPQILAAEPEGDAARALKPHIDEDFYDAVAAMVDLKDPVVIADVIERLDLSFNSPPQDHLLLAARKLPGLYATCGARIREENALFLVQLLEQQAGEDVGFVAELLNRRTVSLDAAVAAARSLRRVAATHEKA